ncbi:MAG: stage V sporulation protein AB [Lachnospiraceae bacterium]|nr:stage V sporulation protein AB [Lachnospiraceae bacterium]
MVMLKYIILAIIGFSSGVIVAGGIFAFIAIIGIVPRFAQKTGTQNKIMIYEDAIIIGGILGCLEMFIDYSYNISVFIGAMIAFFVGIFVGSLAVSLAEIIDVVPIFMRRARLTNGLSIFVLALALGKMFGSLAYFILPKFY